MSQSQLTPEKIKAMSPHERHRLWNNARKRTDEEAKRVVKLIEEAGLPYSDDTSLNWDDPISLKIYEIIFSVEARPAMIEATERGQPAISGVDQMLSNALGVDYGGHNMSTNIAGRFVAERMHQLGYKNSRRKGQLPEGSIAKTGEIFVKRLS